MEAMEAATAVDIGARTKSDHCGVEDAGGKTTSTSMGRGGKPHHILLLFAFRTFQEKTTTQHPDKDS